jgi:hypothetical protein
MTERDIHTELTKITEAIDIDLHIVIACVETLKPIQYDEKLNKKFDNTYSAHILNYLLHALHRDGISCVWRMWDRDVNSNSIPSLIKKLDNPRSLDVIIDRRRNALLDITKRVQHLDRGNIPLEEMEEIITKMAEMSADNVADDVERRLTEIKDLASNMELEDLLDRSKNWRDRHVAHNTELTRSERKSDVKTDPVKWGELEKIVELTVKIFVPLRVLVDDLSIFPGDISKNYKKYSSAFWGAMKDDIK